MLQRMGIRSKMLLTVAVPLLVLLLTGIAVVGFSWLDLNSARSAQTVVTALDDARDLGDTVTTERYYAVNFLDALQLGRDDLRSAQLASDSAYETVMANLVEETSDEETFVVEETTTSDAAESLRSEVDALVMVGDELVPELRGVDIETTEEGLAFPSDDDATQLRLDYANVAAAIERLANSSDAETTGTARYLRQLANALNAEGLAALQLFTEPVELREQMLASFAPTEEAIAALTITANAIADSDDNAPVLARIDDGREALEDLEEIRTSAVLGTGNSSTVLNYYTRLITLNNESALAATGATADADLTSRLQAFAQLDALTESLEYEKIVVQRLIRDGEFGVTGVTQLRELSVRAGLDLDDAQAAAQSVSTLDAVPEFWSVAVGDTGTNYVNLQTTLLGGLDSSLVAAQEQPWAEVVDLEVDHYTPFTDQVWEEIVDSAQTDVQSLIAQLLVVVAAVVIAFLVAVIVANAIARRIVQPLRRLTTTATAVRQELPRLVERVAMPGESVDLSEVQIPVESEDEVGRLAEAFNGVNAATLSIAAEQAALRGSISEMFVNVARRDQVLLNRQLASIDEMERSEDDPDTLTKLFALDHLATRMRRNSESLLVLAGIDTGRRLRRPMPLSDVIRTASSEIELYERIQLDLDADPQMVGHSALTTAHLFAEILENATVFSDPGTPVMVRTADHANGGFLVEIVDTGIGMNPEELHNANSRVASHQASEILGAQRLGLFVVGRIARRIGARVEISSQEGAGTSVSVVLPAALFDDRVIDRPASSRPSSVVADEVIDNPLTGPAEAAGAARPAPAQGASYTPAGFQEGVSLSGRSEGALPARGGGSEGALPARGGGSLPSRGGTAPSAASAPIPVPQSAPEAAPASAGVEGLIREDAAAAPEGSAVDSATLVAGATSAGLPARRRRAPQSASASPAEAPSANVIGLPARATAEQLSALEGEAGASFTPTVSAAEVAPQSAEQRAAMFRGFRSRGAVDQPPAPQTDAVPATPQAEPEPQPQPQYALPTFAPDETVAPAAASAAPAAPSADQPLATRATPGVAAAFTAGIRAADARHEAPATTGQDPLIQSGFGIPQAGDVEPAPDTGSFVIPQLEDEPASAGVESVSLVEEPPAPRQSSAPAAAPQAYPQFEQAPALERESPAPSAYSGGYAPVEQPVAPQSTWQQEPVAPQSTWQQEPAAYAPQTPVPEAQTSPALGFDDLIHDEAIEDAARGGFFNRLFGRGRRDETAAPTTGAPSSGLPAPAPAPSTPAAPAAFTPLAAPEPAPFAPTPAPAAASAPEPGVFAPSPQAHLYADPEPQAAPAAPSRASYLQQPPQAPAPAEPQPTGFTPAAATPDAGTFIPAESGQGGWSQEAAAVHQMHDVAASTMYSPDQLARPVGWEAAGAEALQAAGPNEGYRPALQIDPEPESDQVEQSDVTSAVFSEFSSLMSERPKVQKTKAGLAKRERIKPVEEAKPLEAEVQIPGAPRDADAVRRRFSNFYSGTQRARSDVAAYQSQSTPSDREQQ